MPSRRQNESKMTKMTAAEERKKRQEKFRKRTGSLFDKVRKLAQDTDAFVALVVRDRAGRVRSFRSSDSLYWPHSIKDLIEKHPSGTHQYLQKRAVSGCWKGVDGDESDSVLVGGNRELAVEDIEAMRVTSAEMETESDSTITVSLGHVDKEVEVGAIAPKDRVIETVKSRETAVDAPGSDNTAADVPGESDNTAVAVPDESNHIVVDVLGPSDDVGVDSLRGPYNATLDADGEPDDTIAELGKSDNIIVDAAGESNNKALDALVVSDSATEVLGESVAIDVLDAAEVDPTTFDYDMMDLDTVEGKNSAEVDGVEMFEVGNSIEAAATLYTMSQHNTSPSFVNLGGWQVVNWPRTAFRDGREGWETANSKLSTGMDRKDLLQGWDWVFQRK